MDLNVFNQSHCPLRLLQIMSLPRHDASKNWKILHNNGITYQTVREIAKTVYMVTSSKWRRSSSPVVMGPFRLLLFSSIVYAKCDCAHVHIDKEWMHCLNSNGCRILQRANFGVEVSRLCQFWELRRLTYRLIITNWRYVSFFYHYIKNILGKDSNFISLWCIEGHYAKCVC